MPSSTVQRLVAWTWGQRKNKTLACRRIHSCYEHTYNYHAFLWNGRRLIDLGALGKQTNDSMAYDFLCGL